MADKVRVGIVGVSGYAGGELARLLLGHPGVDVTYVTSNTYEGRPLSDSFPGMAGRTKLACRAYDSTDAVALCDVVFLAGENGFAAKIVRPLLDTGKKVIDLSADFRLRDLSTHRAFYGFEHMAPELVKQAVYGLPELNRTQIEKARLVANPGCHATAVILSLAPLLKARLIDVNSIVANSLSGVSGAGRSKHNLTYHFPELNESMAPYAVAGAHRHTPEIEQALSDVAGKSVNLSFTPHLIPITRGILATTVAPLAADQTAETLVDVYRKFYDGAPFVVVLGPGKLPATKHTQATNYIHIGVAVDQRLRRVTVTAVEDNLVKGAAGQAVQNMNVMLGLPETMGLTASAVWP